MFPEHESRSFNELSNIDECQINHDEYYYDLY